MNRAVTTMLALAVLAAPLVADEAKKSEKAKKTETAATTTAAEQQPVVTPGEPKPEDSPLVQAAKRSNRLGKKPAIVITNETLKKSGANAHVTTTKDQEEIYIPPPPKASPPTPEMKAAAREELRRKAQAEAKAEQEKQAKAKEERIARAAEASEELYPEDERDEDPAQTEKKLQDAHADQTTTTDQKPPVE